jgi:hypothetical protein
MLQNESCLHFGPCGVMELFWGKIILRFYGKIGKNAQLFYCHRLRISNPDKSSCDKYHRLSFLMSQTWFVYFIDQCKILK